MSGEVKPLACDHAMEPRGEKARVWVSQLPGLGSPSGLRLAAWAAQTPLLNSHCAVTFTCLIYWSFLNSKANVLKIFTITIGSSTVFGPNKYSIVVQMSVYQMIT